MHHLLEDVARGLPFTSSAALDLADELHGATLATVRARFGAQAAPARNEYRGWGRHAGPSGAVVHVPALAGRSALDGVDLCRRFLRRDGSSSTHLVVDWPSGDLLVCVTPRNRAWHAGKAWNHTHMGIDVVSPGPLRRAAAGGWTVPHGKKPRVLLPDGAQLPDADVISFPGSRRRDRPWGLEFWHLITQDQIRGLALGLRLLRLCHPETLDPAAVVRHADVAPGRRADPGPCVPLEQVRDWAWSSLDLDALVRVAPEDWPAWLAEQWASPTGLITAMDRTAPGRPPFA